MSSQDIDNLLIAISYLAFFYYIYKFNSELKVYKTLTKTLKIQNQIELEKFKELTLKEFKEVTEKYEKNFDALSIAHESIIDDLEKIMIEKDIQEINFKNKITNLKLEKENEIIKAREDAVKEYINKLIKL